MMLNVTEEQSINSAFNLTAQGIRAGIHLHSWLEKRKNETATKNDIETQKQETELRSDACSYYRGGHVENTNSTELQTLIQDLRGTEFTRADGNFVFLGDKSDLSYFWKKNEKNLYLNSLGNLLLLSRSKNSTLQNYDFNKKKNNGTGKGYYNGSYSEIEVSQCRDWNKEEIKKRAKNMLVFMKERWCFDFKGREDDILFPKK